MFWLSQLRVEIFKMLKEYDYQLNTNYEGGGFMESLGKAKLKGSDVCLTKPVKDKLVVDDGDYVEFFEEDGKILIKKA